MTDPKGFLQIQRRLAPYRPVEERIRDYGEQHAHALAHLRQDDGRDGARVARLPRRSRQRNRVVREGDRQRVEQLSLADRLREVRVHARLTQLIARPDAGELKQLGRADRAGREQHLLTCPEHLASAASLAHLDAEVP